MWPGTWLGGILGPCGGVRRDGVRTLLKFNFATCRFSPVSEPGGQCCATPKVCLKNWLGFEFNRVSRSPVNRTLWHDFTSLLRTLHNVLETKTEFNLKFDCPSSRFWGVVWNNVLTCARHFWLNLRVFHCSQPRDGLQVEGHVPVIRWIWSRWPSNTLLRLNGVSEGSLSQNSCPPCFTEFANGSGLKETLYCESLLLCTLRPLHNEAFGFQQNRELGFVVFNLKKNVEKIQHIIRNLVIPPV